MKRFVLHDTIFGYFMGFWPVRGATPRSTLVARWTKDEREAAGYRTIEEAIAAQRTVRGGTKVPVLVKRTT